MCDDIPSIYDRLSRLDFLSQEGWSIDADLSREIVSHGMKLSHGSDDDSIWPVQREMLDFAYKVDPNWAAKLVADYDTDPARVTYRERNVQYQLAQRLDLLKSTKLVASQPNSNYSSEVDEESYPRIAWRLLSSLNAGKIATRPPECLREFLLHASNLPFGESYPILAWVVANTVSRYAKTDQANRFIRPIFGACVLACHIISRMSTRTEYRSVTNTIWPSGESLRNRFM